MAPGFVETTGGKVDAYPSRAERQSAVEVDLLLVVVELRFRAGIRLVDDDRVKIEDEDAAEIATGKFE